MNDSVDTNIIYNEDCLQTMKFMPDGCVDLILTDPPYEVDTSKSGGHLAKTSKTHLLKGIDTGFDYLEVWKELRRICKPFQCYMFCSNKQISKLMKLAEDEGLIVNLLVWHKYNAIPFTNNTWRQDAEFIVHSREAGTVFKGTDKVIRKPINPSRFGHPTEKPLSLIKRYVDISSKEGDVVYDPFMGSGTTARACMDLKRKYIGSEINETYCKAAEERLRQGVLL